MDKATAIELLLRPFAGKDRAAAMIGDLLETNPSPGRFWTSSVALLVSVAWRLCAALAMAYAIFDITWRPAFNAFVSVSDHLRATMGGSATWTPGSQAIARELVWALLLGYVAQLECVSAVVALVLYGYRDALTAVSAVLGGLSIGLCWYLSSPLIRTGLLCAMAIAVAIAPATSRKCRGALAALVLATCASVAVGFLMLTAAAHVHILIAPTILGILPLIDLLAISRLHRMFALRT